MNTSDHSQYMPISQIIKEVILEALSSNNIESTLQEIHTEHPNELSHGDYATNVAMQFAKKLGTNPRDLGENIAQSILSQNHEYIEGVGVAGPGFINITLSKKYFFDFLKMQNSIDWEGVGNTEVYKDKKVVCEHTSINLFKPFHVGHTMNNAIGESMKRFLLISGAEVVTTSYPSDVSLGIGKALYSLIEKGGQKALDATKDSDDMLKLFGECYAEGTRLYKEDDEAAAKIREITRNLYAGVKNDTWELYQKGREVNLAYFHEMSEVLGSEFDGYIFESEAAVKGKEIVSDNLDKKEVFEASDGAVIYKGDEEKGLHTRVFINHEGNPTYEGKDIGLVALKHERYSPDISVIVTDHEQGPYFKVVAAAAGEINAHWRDSFVHLTHGRMTWNGEKLSSRLGNVMRASELLTLISDEVKKRVDARDGATPELIQDIAIGAFRFSVLRVQVGKNPDFSPEEALSFNGDSAPYIQYTHARISSLLEKGKAMRVEITSEVKKPEDWETTTIERHLYRFIEIVETCQCQYEPHHLVVYLLELVHAFNAWYAQQLMVDENDLGGTAYRLYICAEVQKVLKKGLWLLGIRAPDKM